MTEPPDRRGDDWGGAEVPEGWGSPPPGPGWASPTGVPQPPPVQWQQPAPPGQWQQPGWQQPPPAGQWQQPGWAPPPAYGFAAPRPGVIPLRPLGLGEVLDGAFTTIRRYPRPTLGIAAVIVVVQQALSFAVNVSVRNFEMPVAGSTSPVSGLTFITVPSILVMLVNAALTALLAGMITIVVGDAVLGRPQVPAREVWGRARPLLWRLIGASILAGILPYLGLIAFIIGGIFLWGALSLTMPALVLERTTVRGALRRSWALAVPDWWRVFGFRLLATIIASFVAGILVVPGAIVIGILAASSGGESALGIPALAVLAVFGAIGAVFTQPFLAAVLALIYVDRRIRAEALDIALASAATGTPPAAPAPPPPGYGPGPG
jgi:hypothetical protein